MQTENAIPRKERSMKKVFIIACIIFFPSVVYSQGEYFKGYGTGDMTCGKYIAKITNDPLAKNSYNWWIDGFVTGTNLEKGRITSTDSEDTKHGY